MGDSLDIFLANILSVVKPLTISSIIFLAMIGIGLFWEAIVLYRKKK